MHMCATSLSGAYCTSDIFYDIPPHPQPLPSRPAAPPGLHPPGRPPTGAAPPPHSGAELGSKVLLWEWFRRN